MMWLVIWNSLYNNKLKIIITWATCDTEIENSLIKPCSLQLLLAVASTPHCHSFAYSICNLHPCACLRCKQVRQLLLALRWPPCLSTGALGSGPAFCCPPNPWHRLPTF